MLCPPRLTVKRPDGAATGPDASDWLLSVSSCTFQFPEVVLNITHFEAPLMTPQIKQSIDIPGVLNSLSVSFHGPHCADTPLTAAVCFGIRGSFPANTYAA
jgi:hypothetical protein